MYLHSRNVESGVDAFGGKDEFAIFQQGGNGIVCDGFRCGDPKDAREPVAQSKHDQLVIVKQAIVE